MPAKNSKSKLFIDFSDLIETRRHHFSSGSVEISTKGCEYKPCAYVTLCHFIFNTMMLILNPGSF